MTIEPPLRPHDAGCADCGATSHTPWEAIACDQLTDARHRRNATRYHRRVAAGLGPYPPTTLEEPAHA